MAPEILLTAVPAGLVEPDSAEAAQALESGAAFPALLPADAAAAAEVVRASLQAAVAASPRAAGAGAKQNPKLNVSDTRFQQKSCRRASLQAAVAASLRAAAASDILKELLKRICNLLPARRAADCRGRLTARRSHWWLTSSTKILTLQEMACGRSCLW